MEGKLAHHHCRDNFTAGPAQLPASVLQTAAKAMIDVTDGKGISIAELGHRTSLYEEIHKNTSDDIASLLQIPPTHSVLFMAAGGSAQFSAVPMNLLRSQDDVADYIVTGSWSQKASVEAAKYCNVNVIFNGRSSGYTEIPRVGLETTPNAAYLYFCANETVDGTEFHAPPSCPPNVPLVGDYSSTLMSRTIPPEEFSKFAVIFAGAQKNMGPPGVCIVIVRNDVIGRALPITPLMLDYRTFKSSKSLYNTPPSISIYIVGLMMQWIRSQGGLQAMEKLNNDKAELLYRTIDNSRMFSCSIKPGTRSRSTAVFKLIQDPDNLLLKKFLTEAEEQSIIGLAGHRSVGGLRAALYNAVSLDSVQRLANFIVEFELRHQ